jgi:hypothetical protein
VFKAIRGRDGCTRDFGRGRYENLSGAISWLTFSRAEESLDTARRLAPAPAKGANAPRRTA